MFPIIQFIILLILGIGPNLLLANPNIIQCNVPHEYFQQLNAEKITATCDQNTLTLVTQADDITIPIPFNLFEDNFTFDGLAKFYNGSQAIQLDARGDIIYVQQHNPKTIMQDKEWIGWKGRFKIFMLSAPGAEVTQRENTLQLHRSNSNADQIKIYLGEPEKYFSTLRYSYLWSWLASLCRGIEYILLVLQNSLTASWGLTIIIFAVLFKLFLLPLTLWVTRLQNEVYRSQAILEPKMRYIKAHFDGEEAHRLLMAEYKQLGITPFYALKPLIGPLIQLPLQIAVFNVLGEMPELVHAPFLWIDSLAYPDTVFHLPFLIPFFGNEIHLLPFLMVGISITATLLFKAPAGAEKSAQRQQYKLYLMALVFFILFYPFPAAMVLFWTLMNFLQLIQQHLVKE